MSQLPYKVKMRLLKFAIKIISAAVTFVVLLFWDAVLFSLMLDKSKRFTIIANLKLPLSFLSKHAHVMQNNHFCNPAFLLVEKTKLMTS